MHKKSALMVTILLVMMSWMTIIVDFPLIYLNTRDLCSCLHSGGFFYPYLTFFLICYWSHDIFTDCPETSPLSGLLPCSLENFFVSLHKLQCFSRWCLSLCHFTLAWVFRNFQKWNIIVDSGSSPDDALSDDALLWPERTLSASGTSEVYSRT